MYASLTGPTQFRTSLACFAICSSDSSFDVSAIIMGVDSKSLPAKKKNDNNKDAAESQIQIFSYAPTHFHCLQMLQSKTLYLVSMQPLLINKSLDVQIA